MGQTYTEASNKKVSSANGIDYTYREVGTGSIPLLLLQHFRGNLDNWDPALVDSLSVDRRVIAFDNAGVGGSSGTTPNNFEEMAHDAMGLADRLWVARILALARLSCPKATAAGSRFTVGTADPATGCQRDVQASRRVSRARRSAGLSGYSRVHGGSLGEQVAGRHDVKLAADDAASPSSSRLQPTGSPRKAPR